MPFEDGVAGVVGDFELLEDDVVDVAAVADDVACVVAASSPDPALQPDKARTLNMATVTPTRRFARMDVPLPVQNLNAT